MPLYKFGAGDVFHNQIKSHPSSSFFIYNEKIYLNKKATEQGSFVSNVGGVPVGHVSLFEYNIDRVSTPAYFDEPVLPTASVKSTWPRIIGPSSSTGDASIDVPQNVRDTGAIYPFVYKGLGKMAFKNVTKSEFINNYNNGDIISGSYMMSSSISRKLFESDDNFNDSNFTGSALKNSLDYAGRLGEHYNFPSGSSKRTNVISIPSIFYGSEIKKGSVSLKYYITGTLAAELRDSRYNGALIQHSGTDSSTYDNEIAGCILYKEGFIILTGSWGLSTGDSFGVQDWTYDGLDIINSLPSWYHFAVGANDHNASIGVAADASPSANIHNASSSFAIDFAGTHKVPTVMMLAHANRGELNYSNNPTYIQYGQTAYHPLTASYLYNEYALDIKNIHSSSYSDPTGSLKKTTYITKVGIYDDKKKLIGIASVAKPVKKTEDRDLTFKLKLDI